jgi:Bacterial capsule synthesis protein PGA_cap
VLCRLHENVCPAGSAGERPDPGTGRFSYVWGDALDELRRATPQARIINLEASITRSRDYAPKGINYKVNPENIACLIAAQVDCCGLANTTFSISARRAFGKHGSP